MAIRRNINYINKDFTEYRAQLINYAQSYFPTTYTDFSETSSGMMFIEQAAYVGDVLSFYLDNQIQENYVQYARQDNNLYQMAYMFGYKPKVTTLATTEIDFYQLVDFMFHHMMPLYVLLNQQILCMYFIKYKMLKFNVFIKMEGKDESEMWKSFFDLTGIEYNLDYTEEYQVN